MKFIDIGKLGFYVAVVALTACAGERLMEDRYSMDYLTAQPGKPLVYPEGVERPERSLEYDIPDLKSKVAVSRYDVNEMVKPPRLVPLPEKEQKKAVEKRDEKRRWKVKNGHQKRKQYIRVSR